MASSQSGVKSWLLDKYAKFVVGKHSEGLSAGTADSFYSKNGGEWKQFSSLERQGSLQITLIEDKHLMLSSGTQIHESFSLVNASQWLKTVCKGDSLLFLLNINNETRRFRVKFANTGVKTGWDNCHDFVNNVSPLFPVKEIPISDCAAGGSQSRFMEDSQLFTTPPGHNQDPQGTQSVPHVSDIRLHRTGSSIPEIASQILSGEQSVPSMSTTLPTSDLSTLVKLCLTDPGFPDFVEKVEHELKELTSQN